jgi:hypothetical protein
MDAIWYFVHPVRAGALPPLYDWLFVRRQLQVQVAELDPEATSEALNIGSMCG